MDGGAQLRLLGDVNSLVSSTQKLVGLCFSNEEMLQADRHCQDASEAVGRVLGLLSGPGSSQRLVSEPWQPSMCLLRVRQFVFLKAGTREELHFPIKRARCRCLGLVKGECLAEVKDLTGADIPRKSKHKSC